MDEPVTRKWAWCDFSQAAASRQTGHYILKKRKKKKKKKRGNEMVADAIYFHWNL